MIGCDNDDCAIEWFHFACVGLNPNAEVKGKWICPPCRRKEALIDALLERLVH